jgi:AcrR family transcriptional regulator
MKALMDKKMARAPKRATPITHAKRRDEAERRMLAAAAEIICDHGVDGLTLTDVGMAAGYSRGLPAHYFGNKTGLLEAIAIYIVDGFASRLAETSEVKPGFKSLLNSIDLYLSEGPRSRKHATIALQAVIAESLSEPALRPTITSLNDRSIKRLGSMMRVGIANSEIRRDVDVDQWAMMILGGLRSIITMWLIDPREIDLAQVRAFFVASINRALAP